MPPANLIGLLRSGPCFLSTTYCLLPLDVRGESYPNRRSGSTTRPQIRNHEPQIGVLSDRGRRGQRGVSRASADSGLLTSHSQYCDHDATRLSEPSTSGVLFRILHSGFWHLTSDLSGSSCVHRLRHRGQQPRGSRRFTQRLSWSATQNAEHKLSRHLQQHSASHSTSYSTSHSTSHLPTHLASDSQILPTSH